jgi:predicted amidophosphoribosyltransferase
LVKGRATESQTRKRRFERWKNVEGGFGLSDASAVSGKGVLLVDDVVTTGATLEACAQVLVQGSANRLCLATVACTW